MRLQESAILWLRESAQELGNPHLPFPFLLYFFDIDKAVSYGYTEVCLAVGFNGPIIVAMRTVYDGSVKDPDGVDFSIGIYDPGPCSGRWAESANKIVNG